MQELKYVSASKYAKMTGLGVEEVKKRCKNGTLESFITEGGYYKIALRQNTVSKEEYDKVVRENEKLKGIIQSVNLATNISLDR